MVVLAPQKFALLFTLGRMQRLFFTCFYTTFGICGQLLLPYARVIVLSWELFSTSRTFSFPEVRHRACMFIV